MMQYSSTQASKKGGQMLEHWGHLCETCEGAGAANLYFDRKSWMEHFNSHPKLYIPSTLNIDLILWHTQLIVCAVEC